MVHQTNKNFKWLLFLDVSSPDYVRKRVGRWLEKERALHPIYVELFTPEEVSNFTAELENLKEFANVYYRPNLKSANIMNVIKRPILHLMSTSVLLARKLKRKLSCGEAGLVHQMGKVGSASVLRTIDTHVCKGVGIYEMKFRG